MDLGRILLVKPDGGEARRELEKGEQGRLVEVLQDELVLGKYVGMERVTCKGMEKVYRG